MCSYAFKKQRYNHDRFSTKELGSGKVFGLEGNEC